LVGIECIAFAGAIAERKDKKYRKQGGYKSAEIHANSPFLNPLALNSRVILALNN